MESRQKKISAYAQLQEKQIDQMLKQLGQYETAIIQKTHQVEVLEKYKRDYSAKSLNGISKNPINIKNIFNFLMMIQENIEKIQNDMQVLQEQKQKLIGELEVLYLKKDAIHSYLKKITEEFSKKISRLEQKEMDEIAVLAFMRERM